ncbi:hypothetical protein [Bacillus dakarensis]|uniref:hypothetical protein n=1 Tax=Robertmurraya dakarensis TaxID=1926278 RepID=UPI0009824908|nr:hypothetical protein [Bacillus dakarensis]
MNKEILLKNLQKASQGNFFTIEIPTAKTSDEQNIREWTTELESEGRIKLREYLEREYSVYLHGIIKYASE